MSRIAKQPIKMPVGVTIKTDAAELAVKGPKGELVRRIKDDVKITVAGEEVQIEPSHKSVFADALSGTYASHLRNMIKGVTEGFEKKLLIDGVGYRYAIAGSNIKLDLGFSHPVEIPIPADIKVTVEKNAMTINGIDKEAVGQFAAKIRSLKVVEPYKGKGIRYSDEIVRRKQGKKAGATA